MPESMMTLGGKTPRHYQQSAVDELRSNFSKGFRSQLLLMPTGSGKTFVASMILKRCEDLGNHATFIAHRRELILSASKHLSDFGINHGVIMAGTDRTPVAPIQVASKATLISWTKRNKINLPASDIVVLDECHTTLSKGYLDLVAKFRKANPQTLLLGLTATAARGDGRALGDLFDIIVRGASYKTLIAEGSLVKTIAFAPHVPDFKDVPVVAGEWEKGEVDKRMNRSQLIGDIYAHWQSLAPNRPTIGFASSVAHSIAMRDEFRKHGVCCEHIDAQTGTDERDQISHDLNTGDIQVVWNCDIYSEGTDFPCVSCIILAAPTRSIVKFRQRAGRSMRPYPGKENCLLIDHSGAVLTHGYPDEDIPWTLEGENQCAVHRKSRDAKEATERVCPKCFCVFVGRNDCPQCGHARSRSGKAIAVKNGLLRKVKRSEVSKEKIGTKEDKQSYWHMLMAQAANKGMKCGAAAHRYKKKFGIWPRNLKNMPKGKSEWNMLASELFPQYLAENRIKKKKDDTTPEGW